MFAQNPHYVACELLLKRLHRLIAYGKGDTAGADAVREALSELFPQLDKAERGRLNGLSGDLYQLQNSEVFETMGDPSERTEERLRAALNTALANTDAEAMLSLLRKGPAFMTTDQMAFVRANAYKRLGHIDTAVLFMQYASEENPSHTSYKAYVLRLLDDLGRTEEAIAQASLRRRLAAGLDTLVLAASILYVSTRDRDAEDAQPTYSEVASILERALGKAQELVGAA